MGSSAASKSRELFRFLEEVATLREKRIPAYGDDGDKVFWFGEVPRGRPEIRSAFLADNPDEFPDLWLEVRKKRRPPRPALPESLKAWVRPQDLDQADQEPELRVADPDAPPELGQTMTQKVPPEVEDAWLEYLVDQWEPWAREMRSWEEAQRVYEDVDFMRRRIEEAEERYELLLAVGLLQWRCPNGVAVKRHLLTAPAELSLDAARGVLTVRPAAFFEKFRVELDMLEPEHQPRLEGTDLEDRLEALDVCAWDKAGVAEILHIIANKASANAEVIEDAWTPLGYVDETFRVSYAPALVLREQRSTAYKELVSRFLKAFEDKPPFSTTAPWEHFVSEGETSGRTDNGAADANYVSAHVDGRLYFPLPVNDEQREIAERLRSRPYVLVKGPPGTGKSHTIANLICHLLAIGERVLVTAHAPKALTVLRDLLPGDIRNLCVTALGSSREDHRLLEDSVRGILSRKNKWSQERVSGEIAQLEKELRQLEDEGAKVARQLREYREAETHSHTLPGGYGGTAAQIARQIEKEGERHGWFPELADDQKRCPLEPEDVAFVADVHTALTQERLNELRLDVGTFPLPDPTEFETSIKELNDAEDAANAALASVPNEQRSTLHRFPDASLDACTAFLNQLEEQATRASRTLGNLTGEILKDLLVGQAARWDRLEQEAVDLVKKIQVARERTDPARIDVPSDIEDAKLLSDARRRLEHFREDGRRGWRFFAPRVVRETRYIEERCRVNGESPRDQKSLDTLVGFLELKDAVKRFCAIWPATLDPNPSDPRRAANEVCDLTQQLCELLTRFRSADPGAMDIIPIETRESLSERNGRTTWRRLIEAETARRRVAQARAPLEEWRRPICGIAHESVHPCMGELAQAIEDRDPAKWDAAWRTREGLKADKDRLLRYQKLLNTVREAHPELATLLQSTQGHPEWKDRLSQLREAWAWAAAKAWLRKVTDPKYYEGLAEERHRLQKRIEKKLEALAAMKAWQAFFLRLDNQTEQNLIAWTKAVARIGKGTGKYAYQHRRVARQYLMACIPKMPAWIMPLHKLWETTDPTPGVFDTIIVDEASQAGIEALALFLLAKRIIVVGDDKQNSPEAVGIREADVARLADKYLQEFQFRKEFRPDTSLYDHAERAFGNPISLREHFRCVPEIIRFSNDLCYKDAPLIPLRQPPPGRLPPLKAEFVEGECEGKSPRILNRAEAEAIVDRIQKCLADKEYEGKTMGVIVLQGHAQAGLIEKKLAEVIDPKVHEERKLRCGVPATFQGDQRDVIFLSLVVAPNYSFTALTTLPDERRFNVAMSRARDQVWLFHSVQLHDLPGQEDLRRRLLKFFYPSDQGALEELYEELDRLDREAGRRPRKPGDQPDPYDSWFEVDVALELLRRKYRLRPQFEVAGYRLDLMVEGLTNRLAVECDGDTWHGPERFEQDTARQRQLERAGWTFVRIREAEFYADRKSSVDRIVKKCEELGIRPIGDEEPTERAPAVETLSGKNEDAEEAAERTGEDRRTVPSSEESNFPDPRYGSSFDVEAALYQLIEKEGPLNKRLLYKLYVAGCPALKRASKNVRSFLNRALHRMEKAGRIVVDDELGDSSLESQVLRLVDAPRVRKRTSEQRQLLEIPPSELWSVFEQLWSVFERIQASPTSTAEDDEAPIRALLEHYGFHRLTKGHREYITRILERYRRGESKLSGAAHGATDIRR